MRYDKPSAGLETARRRDAVREAAKNGLGDEAEDDVHFRRLGPIGVKAADLSDRRLPGLLDPSDPKNLPDEPEAPPG